MAGRRRGGERVIWLTSDLHLNHERMIGYAHRPFADVDEMGVTLVRNINERLGVDDTLWILGDVCMGQDKPARCASFLSRLTCQDVRLVRGNHDPKDVDALLAAGFVEVFDLTEISLGGRQKATLCHYPMLSWNRRARGSLMLHGHIHSEGVAYNEGNRQEGTLRYDVGVDANGYAPVSVDDIKRFFSGVAPCDPFMP